MRSEMVTVLGGLILLAAVGWQAFELRRLSRSHAELSASVAALSARLGPLALAAETQSADNPPAPPGQTPSEMAPPSDRTGGVLIQPPPGAAPPRTDETGGQIAAPAVSPCRASCERAVDCALSGCGVGTTGTDALFAECEATCDRAADLATALDAETRCEAVIATARARLPAFERVCASAR